MTDPDRVRPRHAGRLRRPEEPAGVVSRLVVDTPIGPLVLEGDDESITHLHLPSWTSSAAANSPAAASPAAGSASGRTPGPLRSGAMQLAEYFGGRRTEFSLPLAPAGTAFQLSVWRALAEIPFGATRTYGELARHVGRPLAVRAVGQANGANPLPIFYPCHRVVAAHGRLGGYGGGLGAKRALLRLEGATWSLADTLERVIPEASAPGR